MTLLQAEDFRMESETLFHAIETLDDTGLQLVTQFKGWTIEDILVHLHFWNIAADLTIKDDASFRDFAGDAFKALNETGSLRDVCLLYTSPSPRDQRGSRMPSSA